MRKRIYLQIAKLVTKHNNKVLFAAAVITIMMAAASTGLGIKNRLADMMPANVPQVDSFNKIVQDFTSDAIIMISVNSKDKNEKRMIEAAKAIAEDMAVIEHIQPSENQKLSLIQKWKISNGEFPVEGVLFDTINYVKRVDSKLDTDFFEKHGAIIQKNKDVKSFVKMYEVLEFADLLRNINDNFEEEFVGDSENLSSLDGESKAVMGLNNIYNFVNALNLYMDNPDSSQAKKSIRKFIIGDDYMFSSDRTMLLLGVMPSISTDDFDNLLVMSEIVTQRMEKITAKFPDLKFGLAGTPIIGYQEQTAIMNDFGWSTLIALLIVMVIIIGSFQSWKNPFNSIVTLVVSIIWVAGFLTWTLKYLNTMSAAFGVILVGLGIDFAIHFLSGYKDALDHGEDPVKAVKTMYLTVGNGVLTGAMTTAMVFFTLMLIGFKAFSDMGFSMGVGIITAMSAMFIILPAMIIWDSREHPVLRSIMRKIGLGFLIKLNKTLSEKGSGFFSAKPFSAIGGIMQFRFMENIGKFSKFNIYIVIVLALSVILTALSIYGANKLEYEYDMTKLEPKDMPSITAQDEIIDKLEISPDFAMFSVANTDSARVKVKELKKLADRTEIIGRIDAVTEFYECESEQLKNKILLKKYRSELLKQKIPSAVEGDKVEEITLQLQRLHDNIAEIGELSIAGSGLKNKIISKCDEIVGKKDDESKILKIMQRIENSQTAPEEIAGFQKAYIPELRKFLYNITDTVVVSFDNLPLSIKERYVNENNGNLLISIYPKSNIWEEKTLRRFHEQTRKIDDRITGMPILMLIFIDLIKDKGTLSVILGTIVIIILLLMDFRSVKYTVMALIPLIVGAVWMLGLMYLLGMKLNLNNFMALPIIIGIGIDDGVHILHRYMIEGRNSMDKVTKFTGKAILLTSLTTMIGFGSIGIATHRGLASMGIVLVLGVGSCFISSAFLLPTMVSLKDKIRKRG
ncbi:MAG: MMPL family transporter [Candidatus Delongbacteria bacterium]|nr:MMPL family transporter [Candidatus Delongbacteria bacterium]MCG2761463.1 MMPL family transporter [Candidatus Delongbacteria bacterium]